MILFKSSLTLISRAAQRAIRYHLFHIPKAFLFIILFVCMTSIIAGISKLMFIASIIPVVLKSIYLARKIAKGIVIINWIKALYRETPILPMPETKKEKIDVHVFIITNMAN